MSVSWSVIFGRLRSSLARELPPELRSFRWSATSAMAKLWYGNRAIHYEIWVRRQARVVEVGLHFEADALTNARLLGAFRARAKEVSRALGPDARIDDWDRGWTRIWEPLSLASPDEELRERVPARFTGYVRALEPLVREELPADVEWRLPATRARRASASRTSR